MSRRLRPAADSGEFGAFFYNVLDSAGESYMLYTLSGVPREKFERFPMPRNTAVFGSTLKGEGIVRSDDITADPRYGHNPPYHGLCWSIRTHRCSAGTRTQDRHLKSNRPSAM